MSINFLTEALRMRNYFNCSPWPSFQSGPHHPLWIIIHNSLSSGLFPAESEETDPRRRKGAALSSSVSTGLSHCIFLHKYCQPLETLLCSSWLRTFHSVNIQFILSAEFQDEWPLGAGCQGRQGACPQLAHRGGRHPACIARQRWARVWRAPAGAMWCRLLEEMMSNRI